MNIQIAVKSLAKKNIQSQTIDLPDWDSPNDLQSFLTQLVAQQVTVYHARLESANITASPNDTSPSNNLPNDTLNDYLELLTNTGKVSFGDKYHQQPVDVTTATTTALQAFEDGLFAVFVDDQQIESLQTAITINENSVVSLIRLTFLAGSYW